MEIISFGIDFGSSAKRDMSRFCFDALIPTQLIIDKYIYIYTQLHIVILIFHLPTISVSLLFDVM